MKKTILILFVLMFCTRLFSLEEGYVRKKIKGYYTDVSWNDYKIYPVTEDCSIVVGYIQREGAEGSVSLYDLQLVTDEKLSRVVSVGSVGSKEYRYLGKTSGVDVYYGDFTFDGVPDIARIQDTELSLRVIISSINDLEEEIYLLVSYPSAIHNKSLYPELMSEDYYITFDDIRFCIVNGRRGIRVLTLGELEEYQGWHSLGYSMRSITKGISYSFFYWSPEEQRYVLDETVTQEELENAWCPEDYFAYNGLQFSKLEGRLTDKDLEGLDKAQLRIMRNAVYARHGRPFQSVDLQSLWDCYSWYKKNPEYTDDLLTETDKYNISLIQKYEMESVVSAVSGTDFEERINSVDQRNNALQAVSGPDFEERINEQHWIRSYFNQVIYCGDRNIIVEYQPEHIKQPYFYDEACSDVIFWYEAPNVFWDHIKCTSLENGIHDNRILIGTEFNYKVNKINSVFYEVQIEDVRISQEMYKYLLQHGHDMKFALDATEPEYSFYFWFNGDYLYIYLEDRTTLYATYCAYDENEIVALQEAIRTNEFDISEFTLPRYADGSWDFANGKGVNIKKIVGGTYQAKENLQLRETEGTSGEIITTIQADTCMEILSLGKEDTIDGITDNWVKVELLWGAKNLVGDLVMGETGWCFGGHLKAGYYEEPELFVPTETTNETEFFVPLEMKILCFLENYLFLIFPIILTVVFIHNVVKIIKSIRARKKDPENNIPVSSLILICAGCNYILLISGSIFLLRFFASTLIYISAGVVAIVREKWKKKEAPGGLSLVITGEIVIFAGLLIFFSSIIDSDFIFYYEAVILIIGIAVVSVGNILVTEGVLGPKVNKKGKNPE